MTRGGRVVIKSEKWADVVYGWPLSLFEFNIGFNFCGVDAN